MTHLYYVESKSQLTLQDIDDITRTLHADGMTTPVSIATHWTDPTYNKRHPETLTLSIELGAKYVEGEESSYLCPILKGADSMGVITEQIIDATEFLGDCFNQQVYKAIDAFLDSLR